MDLCVCHLGEMSTADEKKKSAAFILFLFLYIEVGIKTGNTELTGLK